MLWFFGPWNMWGLSSPARERTHTPCIGRRGPDHWTTREVPSHRSFGVLSVTELPSLLLNFIYISLVQTSILNIQLKFLISSLSFNRLTPNIFQELFPGPPNLNWVLFLCVSRAPYLWHNTVPNSTVNFLRINTVFNLWILCVWLALRNSFS